MSLRFWKAMVREKSRYQRWQFIQPVDPTTDCDYLIYGE